MAAFPNPDERRYRIRLPPWVRTPKRVTPGRVPHGQSRSLHRPNAGSSAFHPTNKDLSGGPGFVRRLRRYFGTVRLPTSVHPRRTCYDFPMRPAALSAAAGRGISRSGKRCFRICPARDPHTPCASGSPGVAFLASPWPAIRFPQRFRRPKTTAITATSGNFTKSRSTLAAWRGSSTEANRSANRNMPSVSI